VTPESFTESRFRPTYLASQLKDFVESSVRYEPRKWVMENGVDCVSSSRTLNEALKEDALAPRPAVLRPAGCGAAAPLL
jgi:hypothetical protein